ncbi:MAG: hypothetical protein WCS86_01110 [Candidatus Paceibacterota bacterium]
MRTGVKTMIKIFLITPIVFFSSNILAIGPTNPINEYDSIYKYNALENKINFFDTTNNTSDSLSLNEDKSIEENIQKLQEIIIKQNNSKESSENAINNINNNSELKTFIFGNGLGTLRFQMVQMKDQNYVLSILSLKNKDDEMKTQIDNQISISKEEQAKVQDFILSQSNKFNLLGWFVNSL